tara:strand:+ start:326 stop:3319 length:2994 start_codon:yes stop_codon:yes gene_type:complete
MKRTNKLLRGLASLGILGSSGFLFAQSEQDVYELSPFSVDVSGDVGYAAQNTLAGSRLNSRLKDTPAPLSVYTSEFMSDISADSVEDALDYSVNMTPELSQDDGTGSANQLTAFDARYRIRGIDADLSRNYFAYSIDQDVYNIERVDESRGPNSILFGIAKAGGLINTSTKKPTFGREFTTFNVTVGDADRFRAHLDANKVLLDGKLALRVNLLHNENGENERPWVARRDDRWHAAIQYRPLENTVIDFEYEYADVIDQPTQFFSVTDDVSVWLANGRPLVGEGVGADQGVNGSFAGGSTYGRISYVDNTGTIANYSGAARTLNPNSIDTPFTFETNVLNDPAGEGTITVPVYASASGPLLMRGARDIRMMSANVSQKLGENTFVELAWAKYETDRFSHRMGGDVSMEGDPNPTLADGSPNPNAGRIFFESRLERDFRYFTDDYIRGTISHEINTDGWMGNHRLAAMVQSRDRVPLRRLSQNLVWNDTDNWGLTDSSGRPYGGPFNRTPWNGRNRVHVRHYLDDPTDVADYRVGTFPGVGYGSDWDGEAGSITTTVPFSSLWYSNQFPGTPDGQMKTLTADWATLRVKGEQSGIDALMAAGQSYFLNDRLVLTYGYREDDFYLFSPAGNGRNNSFNNQRDILDVSNALVQEFVGETETYGGVYHINENFSLTYNSSTNAGISDFSDKDIIGPPGETGGINPVPNGKNEDIGVTYSALGGKVFLKAAFFETSSNNISSFPSWASGNVIGGIKQLYNQLEDSGLITNAVNEAQNMTAEVATRSEASEGFEFTMVGNLTDNWRAIFNYSDTEVTLGANLPEFNPWWGGSTGKSFFQQFSSEPLFDAPGFGNDMNLADDATVGDAIAAIEQSAADMQALVGGLAVGQRQEKWSMFTNYTFDEGPLKNFRVGGGARYTDGRYHPGFGGNTFNSWLFYDAVVGWQKRFDNYTLDLQLNVKNLFDEDELSITRLDIPRSDGGQNALRYILPNRRDIRLRASFRF